MSKDNGQYLMTCFYLKLPTSFLNLTLRNLNYEIADEKQSV